jgi:hypothetical protein
MVRLPTIEIKDLHRIYSSHNDRPGVRYKCGFTSNNKWQQYSNYMAKIVCNGEQRLDGGRMEEGKQVYHARRRSGCDAEDGLLRVT